MTWDKILGNQLHEKVKTLAKIRGLNVKVLVIIAVREYLERNKEDQEWN